MRPLLTAQRPRARTVVSSFLEGAATLRTESSVVAEELFRRLVFNETAKIPFLGVNERANSPDLGTLLLQSDQPTAGLFIEIISRFDAWGCEDPNGFRVFFPDFLFRDHWSPPADILAEIERVVKSI